MPVEGLPPAVGAAGGDPERDVEVLRLWFIDGKPSVVFKPAFQDPEWFGVCLADACRQAAAVYQQFDLMGEEDAFRAITTGLLRGLSELSYTPGAGLAETDARGDTQVANTRGSDDA